MFGLPENLPNRRPAGARRFPSPGIRYGRRHIPKAVPAFLGMLIALAPGVSRAADFRTFLVTWSGESFGNNATANAELTVDMDLINNPGKTVQTGNESGFIRDFSITVEGAQIGNGTWSKTNYDYIRLDTGISVLDFTRELVGQSQWEEQSLNGGDFDLAYVNNHGPRTVNPFIIGSNAGDGDRMRMTSFRPGPSIPLTLKPDFSEDYGRGMNGDVFALAEDSQGRLVAGGAINPFDYERSGIARFFADGEWDRDLRIFDGFSGGSSTRIEDLAVLPDDSIVAVGEFELYQNIPRGGIIRILENGDLVTDFASGRGANGTIRTIRRLPDGSFLIGGDFTEYDETESNRLARIDANGALDTTFEAEAFGDAGDFVEGITLLEGGGALVWGRFSEYGGHATHHIARILADGGVDTSFSAPDMSAFQIEAIAVLETGKILVGARGTGRILFQLGEDGTLDADFNPAIKGSGVHSLLVMKDGRLLLGGKFTDKAGKGVSDPMLLRQDGTVDENGFRPAVVPNNRIETFFQTSGGSIFAGGSFTAINGVGFERLARFEAFNPDAYFLSDTGTVTEGEGTYIDVGVRADLAEPQQFRVTVESDDPSILPLIYAWDNLFIYPGPGTVQIYVNFQNDSAINGPRSFRLIITPEVGGASVGIPDVMTITVQDDDVPGTVFLGTTRAVLTEGRGALTVKVKRFLNDTGSLSVKLKTVDGTAIAGRDYQPVDTTVDFPDGVFEKSVEIGGPQTMAGANPLRQFTVELSDPSAGGRLGYPATTTVDVNDKDDAGSSLIDYTVPDPSLFYRGDRIAMDGEGTLYAITTYRLNPSAGFETRVLRFSPEGVGETIIFPISYGRKVGANVIEFGTDGMLYLGGSGFIQRYFPDGTIDDTWTNPIAYDASLPSTLQGILPLPDGKVMISGRISDPIGGILRNQVARLMPDGSIDPSFDMGAVLPTGSTRWIYEMARDPSGKILLAGNFSSVQGVARTNVVRLLPDGAIDTTFDASAAVSGQGLTSYVNRIAVTPGGKIYLGGNDRIIRVTSTGGLDAGFPRVNGKVFALQPDGKLLVGIFNSVEGSTRVDEAGQTDGSFRTYFPQYGSSPGVEDVLLGVDGRVHFAGWFGTFDGLPAPGIATVRGDAGSVGGNIVWESGHIAIGEGVGSRMVKLRRTGSSVGNVGVHYTLVQGTAGAGTDVAAVSGYHEFLPGETEHEVGFDVTNDSVPEGVESFRFVLHDTSGGARTGDPGTLAVDIVDDDGTGFESWISRFYPSNPLDASLADGDPDGDGVKTFVEWMTDSDPNQNGDAKNPAPSWHETMTTEGAEMRLGISFYLNPSKTGFRTIVERSETLKSDSWSMVWDSSADPMRESDLIPGDPPVGSGWMSVRSPVSPMDQEFLRIRYEAE